jgi:hypothetical protein
MSKLLKELTQFFVTSPNALEAFINSKSPKTHADVEYWTRYFETQGTLS